jgi:hypothetical protein
LLLAAVLFLGMVAAADAFGECSKGRRRASGSGRTGRGRIHRRRTRDHLEWNRTRWAATSDLLASGIPRTSIDGGYEFNGWLGYDAAYQAKPGRSPWWVVDDEYTIASGPMPGFAVHRTYTFRRLLTGQNSTILVLRRSPK